MVLLIEYAIIGVKKGHKKYKERQAEKEQRLLEERGQLPDLQDPSRELDTRCQAKLNRQQSSGSASLKSSRSSHSTRSAERALENDPGFKAYMERHKSLYLQQQRQAGLPPSYNALMQDHLSPTPSSYSPTGVALPSARHCSCHECMSQGQSAVPELVGHNLSPQYFDSPSLPGHETTRSLTPRPATTELGDTQTTRPPVSAIAELDNQSAAFELPGNLPAILPPSKRETPIELPAQSA